MFETTRTRPLPPGMEPITGEEARPLIRHTEGPPFRDLLARADAVRDSR